MLLERPDGFDQPLSLADLMIASGVVLLVAGMLFPAVGNSRQNAQRLQCQNNLKELSMLFSLYADRNAGYYPVVRPNEHAGIYPIRLMQANLAGPNQLSGLLVCPSSPKAEQLAEGDQFDVPSLKELSLARGLALVRYRQTSGGSYGYQIGWVRVASTIRQRTLKIAEYHSWQTHRCGARSATMVPTTAVR